jgi:Aldo/keto reductase family
VRALERLGVDYVDLIQCHDVEFADHDQIVNETLPALHRLKGMGWRVLSASPACRSRFSQASLTGWTSARSTTSFRFAITS